MTLVACACGRCERFTEADALAEPLCGECRQGACVAFGDACVVLDRVLAVKVPPPVVPPAPSVVTDCKGCDGSAGAAHSVCGDGRAPCDMCRNCPVWALRDVASKPACGGCAAAKRKAWRGAHIICPDPACGCATCPERRDMHTTRPHKDA